MPETRQIVPAAAGIAVLLLLAACGERAAPTAEETPEPAVEAAPAAEERAAAETAEEELFVRRFGIAEPRPKAEGTVRLATYNVENLFDDADDPALSGRYEDAGETKPEHERRAIAETIRRIDADVLALQEVESEEALRWFLDEHLSDMGYEHVISIDAGDERGIEQAVLSRYPIVDVNNWPRRPLGGTHPERYGDQENWNAGQEIVFHRSPLMVTVEVPAGEGEEGGEPYRLTVFAVHQKSGRYSGYWREAEARGLMEILGQMLAEDPEMNAAVLGDFNAEADAEEMAAYFEAGLEDVFAGAQGPESVTHESGRRIDLILVTEGLAADIVGGSSFVLGTPARPASMDWRSVPTFEGKASDHYPVVVDVDPREGAGGEEG